MRPLTLAVPTAVLLALAACAPTTGANSSVNELQELSDSS